MGIMGIMGMVAWRGVSPAAIATAQTQGGLAELFAVAPALPESDRVCGRVGVGPTALQSPYPHFIPLSPFFRSASRLGGTLFGPVHYGIPRTEPKRPVQEAILKADVLIEAMGWIRQFRDSVTVIKLGGSLLEDEEALRHLLIDIVFMETVGMKPVVVHGGGKAISRAMDAAGLEPRFVQGRRYTDDATLEIAERVLGGEVNELLAQKIEDYGGRAMPLNTAGETNNNVLYGERIQLTGDDGDAIDLGHVGQVTRVDRDAIDNLCFAGQVPVIPCLCESDAEVDSKRQLLNVNADTAAMAVAEALGAEKLVFLSDVEGVLRDQDVAATRIPTLTPAMSRELIAEGVIAGGMIPKVEACLQTLDRGVGKVHIIDGRLRHSLLLEIYTNEGVGTQIIHEPAA